MSPALSCTWGWLRASPKSGQSTHGGFSQFAWCFPLRGSNLAAPQGWAGPWEVLAHLRWSREWHPDHQEVAVPRVICPLHSPYFCARFSQPGHAAAPQGCGPPGHHRTPALGPCLWHQCHCPDVSQYFLSFLFCLDSPLGWGRGAWRGEK